MEKLGIIVGSGLYTSEWIQKLDKDIIIDGTKLKECNGNFILQRHGDAYLPPHLIEHEENLRALQSRGIDKVIGICSVGSLKENIRPGTFCIPSDYIDFWSGTTIYSKESVKHVVPELDVDLQALIIDNLPKNETICAADCTYVQTTGPRLETKAEIRLLKAFGHLVGMTMGSEATIAKELGLKYAALCMVDNYANGLKGTITSDQIGQHARESRSKLEAFIKRICGYEHTD
jgi:5'-methylthioadenosine phosphorylase